MPPRCTFEIRGWDSRGLKTERAINFKIRATWFTPEVIRASARHTQIRNRLSDDETRALVREAENAGHTVILVEIDPNEGSGIIPSDWEGFLQPQGASSNSSQGVRGVDTPDLRKLRALQGVMQRNYDYDRFWVVFPLLLSDGKPLFPAPLRKPNLWFDQGQRRESEVESSRFHLSADSHARETELIAADG